MALEVGHDCHRDTPGVEEMHRGDTVEVEIQGVGTLIKEVV